MHGGRNIFGSSTGGRLDLPPEIPYQFNKGDDDGTVGSTDGKRGKAINLTSTH